MAAGNLAEIVQRQEASIKSRKGQGIQWHWWN